MLFRLRVTTLPELAADLIKKGLRPIGPIHTNVLYQLAADLIKKGLRPRTS